MKKTKKCKHELGWAVAESIRHITGDVWGNVYKYTVKEWYCIKGCGERRKDL